MQSVHFMVTKHSNLPPLPPYQLPDHAGSIHPCFHFQGLAKVTITFCKAGLLISHFANGLFNKFCNTINVIIPQS